MTSECRPGAVAEMVRLGREHAKGELETRVFSVHGVTTSVVSNSEKISGAIAKLLRPFGAASPDAHASPDIVFHLFAVEELTGEMAPLPPGAPLLYDWGILKIYHSGPCRYQNVDNRARVLADVESRTAVGFVSPDLLDSDWLISNLFFYPLWAQLLKVAGLFPLHAAGLAKGSRGYLFLGKSGSGKSTLTLNMVRGGYGLLSDDTVFLRLDGDHVEAMCFPEEINIKQETMELLPELSRVKNFTVNDLREKSSFSIDELYPGCVVESSTPEIMVFPEIADSDATLVMPMSRTEALALSMRYGFFFMDPSTTARHFEILSRLARQADCYRLYSGRNQENLERVVDELLARSTNQSGKDKE